MSETLTPTRNHHIDFLRFVGLALIVLAHVNPPFIFAQLRNFDVPLMVLVSALSFVASSNAKNSYAHYVWSRIKRLLFPVWLFLCGLFAVTYMVNPSSSDLAPRTVFDSFVLFDVIGYVWVIRVFLLIALAAPFINQADQSIKNTRLYCLLITFAYLAYEALRYTALPFTQHGIGKYIASIILYIIPYGLLFAYGLRMPRITLRGHLSIFAGALAVFLILATGLYLERGAFVPTQEFKYPPSAYYLSFALIGCQFMWMVTPLIWSFISKSKHVMAVILFIAQNSLWIYLWHIPLIKYVDMHFTIKYALVFSVATLITALQSYIIRVVILPRTSAYWQKNIKVVLTG